jgi:hypothetical protein
LERPFGIVCVAYAHYYVWPKSILFSTIKTDLAYDILSILHKARFMLLGVTLGLPLHPVFHRSGEARDCSFMHCEGKVGSPSFSLLISPGMNRQRVSHNSAITGLLFFNASVY